MVTSCCVPHCTNRSSKISSISFHRFPLSNKALSQKWLNNIKRKNFNPSRSSFVCAAHFTEQDFKSDLTYSKKKGCIKPVARRIRVLKRDAVLTIFEGYPDYRILMNNFIKASSNTNVVECGTFTDIELDFRFNKRFDLHKCNDSVQTPSELWNQDRENLYSSWIYSMKFNSDWRWNVLYYIAGYIVRKLKDKIDCTICIDTLFDNISSDSNAGNLDVNFAQFLAVKQRGGLLTPSYGVFSVVCVAEAIFRSIFPGVTDVSLLPKEKHIDIKIENLVLQKVDRITIFPDISGHIFDNDLGSESDHIIKLIRMICNSYVKIRLLRYGKLYFERNIFCSSTQSRQQATKAVLFRGK